MLGTQSWCLGLLLLAMACRRIAVAPPIRRSNGRSGGSTFGPFWLHSTTVLLEASGGGVAPILLCFLRADTYNCLLSFPHCNYPCVTAIVFLLKIMSTDTVKLASGQQMPLVGFGLWKVPKDTAADTVYNVRSPIPQCFGAGLTA